ncbi:MAG: sigma factor-like helix-turn-helix DNA-binding protein [Roseiarcus sp.]
MTEPLVNPPLKPRRTARDRLVRRERIMERLREGRSYEEIAQGEGLSRERIRQIVVEALQRREVDAQRDHAQLQMLRLAPALRLAARGIAEGDRRSIAELIRVLDRLDKYQAVGVSVGAYDEGAREKLLTKLNSMAQRMIAARTGEGETAGGAEAGGGEAAPDESVAAQNPDSALPWGLKP